jgi:hypothetical protein
MAISKTDLVNKALTLCGAAPITNITDDTNNARIVNRVYDIARRSILTDCRWNFATTRSTLSLSAVSMAWLYTNEVYVYVRPADALRIFGVDNDDSEWREEGDYIISDTVNLGIRYVWDIDNPAKYPPKFTDAFIDRLCSEISFIILNSAPKAEAFLEKYKKVSLLEAVAENGQTGVQQYMKDNAWELSKYFNTNPAA